MSKKILPLIIFVSLIFYSCSSKNINIDGVENIKVELFHSEKNKTIVIYDSSVERSVYYPYFVGCIDSSKRISLFSVPKTITKEGTYFLTLYGKENEVLRRYEFMTPKTMFDVDTNIIYKTEILQEIYVYLAKKSLDIE